MKLWATLIAFAAAAAVAAPPASADENAGRYVYVPNRASADVAVIDTATDRVVTRIRVGKVPHQVAVSATLDKLIASNTADNTISIVDLTTLTVEATVALGATPEHMALGADGRLLAVGNIDAGTVSLVSLTENRELARIDGLFEPHNLTFSADGALLYVANLGADHVSVIDVAARRVIKEIPVAEPTAFAAVRSGRSGAYQGIINVTASTDGRLGFAAHGESDWLAVIDLGSQELLKRVKLGDQPWRAYATPDGRYMLVPNNGDATVSVISTATLEVVATLPGARDMTGLNFAGRAAFVIGRGADKVVVLDLLKMEKAGEIPLPSSPETGVVTPDGAKLYIALSGSNQVAVIDTRSRTLLSMIEDVGEQPWGATMVGARNYCH